MTRVAEKDPSSLTIRASFTLKTSEGGSSERPRRRGAQGPARPRGDVPGANLMLSGVTGTDGRHRHLVHHHRHHHRRCRRRVVQIIVPALLEAHCCTKLCLWLPGKGRAAHDSPARGSP
ncbi:hypothetical protein E2C01_053550 [Portunus trituberculatus]|uniref:Uncharacterized protein n=1 Tax=Portunus trituberculatus TaxID=210409 RepID=A0A5B7GQL5_PORTR|nr:hypothetical protein [Portunus trituberculatus]